MKSIVLKSKVGAGGVLHLSVPVGMAQADSDVQVIVEPVSNAESMTQQEWSAWVDSMAGSWQGDFERPHQGEDEPREKYS